MAIPAADRPSDEELLRGHLSGDPNSFGELTERYTPELFRFLMRFLGRRAMAEAISARQQRGYIGGDPEIGSMSERRHAAKADQQI